MKQRKLDKVIGIGAVLDNPLNVEYDSGTAASDPVFALSNALQRDNPTSFPFKLRQEFPRTGTDASFAQQIVYSDAQGEEDVINEFTVVPLNVIPRIFPNALKTNQCEIFFELAAKVQQYFDQCFHWEMSANSVCASPTNDIQIANTHYGHSCKNGTFHTWKCLFCACSQEYYLPSYGNEWIFSPKYKYFDGTHWDKFPSFSGEMILFIYIFQRI